ncbi:MAG: chromosome segregation protein SMC [Sphaerobacter thermophilus]|uniref:chromosome segregation protein SMC n=1 Tax=Sphaerobacter thermophilus TaxID=2057 RepID=UPI00396E53AC
MPTRLKRLELHGFKSFATPTTFVFDPGITAIIGPNGSGKSNIAEAVRWALGEQSYASLRGRRTEDVIFAGSAARAPLGMAEVSLTLDNESGDLPLPFSEITITRRAYRSGENQYFINGARVRLKDVLQVTASLGQAYTVIGQGLVDAVLSQRPEERRGLFEHAAGITGLRLKQAEAQRHLAETEANSTRLEDLLAEIEPRLRSLERAARQARESGEVRERLKAALLRLYAHQWQGARQRLQAAEAAEAAAAQAVEAAVAAHAAAQAALADIEQRGAAQRAEVERLAAETARLRAEEREIEHRRALAAERRAAQVRRRDDLEQEAARLRGEAEAAAQEAQEASNALQAIDAEIAEREAAIARLAEADAAARAERERLAAALRQAEQAITEAERAALAAASRRDLLDQQERDLLATRERLEREQRARAARLAELEAQAAAATKARDEAREQLAELAAERERLEAALSAAAAARDEAERAMKAVERRLVERTTRLEALTRLRDSGAGLYAGTRAVLDAARAGHLQGIIGTLASLLIVPPELEAAMEAALGGHLQDIVVERWRDAEQAIEHLKRTKAGRATFQPLDTVRGSSVRAPRLDHPGVRGLAVDLIDYDPRVEPVVTGLLGRVVVTDDLTATRAILRALPPGWSVVTLGGEITRSSGAVTGGARVKESGTLARERELRDLPVECRKLERELDAARAEVEARAAEVDRLRAERDALDRDIAAAREAGRAAEAALARQQRLRDDEARAAAEEEQRHAGVAERLARLDADRQEAERAGQEAAARRQAAAAERERLLAALREAETAGPDARLQDERSALAGLVERRRGLIAQQQRLESEQQRVAAAIAEAERRAGEIATAITALDAEVESLTAERERIAALLAAAEEQLGPARAAREDAAAAERAAREAVAGAEQRVRDAERERDRATLELERRRDEVNLLRERAAHDLGEEVDIDAALDAVDLDDTDPDTLQREVDRLRERLRRIGLVGEDAIEQYEREAERYTFLRGQLDDVHAAGEALRALLAELSRSMAEEFNRTFGEVAAAFEATFTTLFGGGKAKLLQVQDDDGATGVDILAQPPGKRLQSLALLSGGERALTAVALLFAILKVNPSPFCVLDEVDAALDEANVVRVRDELKALADRTQFVVVTHNRATIEGADTLYGITMGDDGVSRVLSLRLPAEASA